MKIGLLGFGVVGRGLYDLTQGRDDINITKVVCLEDVTLPSNIIFLLLALFTLISWNTGSIYFPLLITPPHSHFISL